MKTKISYKDYYNQGKQYQLEFNYEKTEEINQIRSILKPLINSKMINPILYNNIITKTNIQNREQLSVIINKLININSTIILNEKEYNNKENINIDNLHVKGVLQKGRCLSQNDVYYLILKPANPEQLDELLYLLHCKINNPSIYPMEMDYYGNIKSSSNSSYLVLNIPESILYYLISLLIEEYKIIVKIDEYTFKDKLDNELFNYSIEKLNNQTVRRKIKQVQ